MEHYSEVKRNKLQIHVITWMDFKHYAQQKKPDTKEHMLYDPTYSEFQKRQTKLTWKESRSIVP